MGITGELSGLDQVLIVEDREFWINQTEQLLAAMQRAGFNVRLREKEDGYEIWWHRLAVKIFKLFANKRGDAAFDNGYITTFGDYIYWTTDEDFDPGNFWHFVILYHECVHIVQRRKFTPLLYTLLYILLPLPFLATGRGLLFERQAYRESARVMSVAGQTGHLRNCVDYWEKQFSGPYYGWMDVFGRGGWGRGGKLRREALAGKLVAKDGYLERIGYSLVPHPRVLANR